MKAFHDRLPNIVSANSSSETWLWMQKGKLKRKTESVLIAAQDQVLRINWIKAKIETKQIHYENQKTKALFT